MDQNEFDINGKKQAAEVAGYRIWPFNATRLFYTRTESALAKKDDKYRMKGIFSYRHAAGFVYDFADKVHKETERCVSAVMIQSGDSAKPYMDFDDGNRIGIDLVREVAGEALSYGLCCQRNCDRCPLLEDDVAKTVLGCEWERFDKDVQAEKIRAVLRKRGEDTPEDEECNPCYVEPGVTKKGFVYFKYNCPWSLVGGVMMPIAVNGYVIAAAIVGQFIWSLEHKKTIKAPASKSNCTQAGKEEQSETLTEAAPETAAAIDASQYKKEAFLPDRNADVIEILEKEIRILKGSLEQRLSRNASGFFSEVISDVHDCFSEKPILKESDFRKAAVKVTSYLRRKFSFEEILCFSPNHLKGKEQDCGEPYGYEKNSRISKKVKSIERKTAEAKTWYFNSDNDVFLTRDDTQTYNLHLFDESGEELWRMVFRFQQLKDRAPIRKEEWKSLCYHMETVLRELYTQWTLAQREEEHGQYQLTMRQFTHELGQKSHAGNACMRQFHEQLSELSRQLDSLLPIGALEHSLFSGCIEKLNRNADDMESIFDGIEYLSQLARAKAKGLQFHPTLFNPQTTILNSLAAQYRIDIRGNGMKLVQLDRTEAPPLLYGDKDLVHIAIHNLISNAVKYGYPGTMIYYSCYRGNIGGRAGVFLDVTDYGLYISEDAREEIFLDGGRLGEERNDSMGFGLYLTKEIMELHGGFCEVAESTIVSDFSLPNLAEMQNYADRIPQGLKVEPTKDAMETALQTARDSGLYQTAVNMPIKVSRDGEIPVTVRSLFAEGCRPMAKTTMRLFFPEEVRP